MIRLHDFGPETISSIVLEDKMKLSKSNRTNISYSQHDLGITTEISISAKDFQWKKNQYTKCRKSNAQISGKWQQRVRVASSPKERRLVKCFSQNG